MKIGNFVFSGFAATLNGKLGFFNIGNNQVLPAIYQEEKHAINDACTRVTEVLSANKNQKVDVVKVEVFSDGSLILLSQDNNLLVKRTFNVELLMDVSLEQSGLSMSRDWLGFVSRISRHIGGRKLQTQHKVISA